MFVPRNDVESKVNSTFFFSVVIFKDFFVSLFVFFFYKVLSNTNILKRIYLTLKRDHYKYYNLGQMELGSFNNKGVHHIHLDLRNWILIICK